MISAILKSLYHLFSWKKLEYLCFIARKYSDRDVLPDTTDLDQAPSQDLLRRSTHIISTYSHSVPKDQKNIDFYRGFSLCWTESETLFLPKPSATFSIIVEPVGEEVQGVSLMGGLEDVGDGSEDLIEEQNGEEGGNERPGGGGGGSKIPGGRVCFTVLINQKVSVILYPLILLNVPFIAPKNMSPPFTMAAEPALSGIVDDAEVLNRGYWHSLQGLGIGNLLSFSMTLHSVKEEMDNERQRKAELEILGYVMNQIFVRVTRFQSWSIICG